MTLGALTTWTVAEGCAATAARAALVAACSVPVAVALRALLGRSGPRLRVAVWALVLAPFLTPAIVVAYTWSSFSLSLIRHPGWNEALYSVLVWMKLTPVAAIVLCLAPSPISAQAVHCRRLLLARRNPGGGGRISSAASYGAFLARGPLLAPALAFALTFLLAFGEFEMASLMKVRTWTVSLFDAQAGGLAISESVWRALTPMCPELALLALVVVVLLATRQALERSPEPRPPLAPVLKALAWVYLAAAAILVTALPCAVVLGGALKGMKGLLGNFVIAQDIGGSLVVAGAAAACAACAAGWLVAGSMRRRAPKSRAACILVLSVPGALGPLVLALLVVFACQKLHLDAIYDTPVPLVLALSLILMPGAFVLWFAAQATRPAEALHAAQLLAPSASARAQAWRSRLVWQLRTRRISWLAFLLFFWAYFELTASAILSPPSMTPISVRLYNQMHYGRTAGLSAMVMAALLAPALLLALAAAARVTWRRLTCAPLTAETASE